MPFHLLEKSCLHTLIRLERGYSAHHHSPSTASTAHLNSSPMTGNKGSCGTKGRQARRRRRVVAPSPSKLIPFTASHSASASSPQLEEHTSTVYHLMALTGQQYPSTKIIISKYQKTRNQIGDMADFSQLSPSRWMPKRAKEFSRDCGLTAVYSPQTLCKIIPLN